MFQTFIQIIDRSVGFPYKFVLSYNHIIVGFVAF